MYSGSMPATRKQSTPENFYHMLLSNPSISDKVFSALSPASLVRFSRTSTRARRAVQSYSRIAYSIDRHLTRFFPHPRVFRALQARTGTLISGSNALQFLDRTFYADSDLDLYVEGRHASEVGEWLGGSGWRFEPSAKQSGTFEESLKVRLEGEDPLPEEADFLPQSNPGWYFMRGVGMVFNFTKPEVPGVSEALKIQLITATLTPMEIILQFHSTCVMNIISFENAYSLYPKATFEERRALIVATAGPKQEAGRKKYADRGWKMLEKIPPDVRYPNSSFRLGDRWLGDSQTWTLPLDTSTLQLTPPPGCPSDFVFDDNLAIHNWILGKDSDRNAEMQFAVLSTPSMQHNYVAGIAALVKDLCSTLRETDSRGRGQFFLDAKVKSWLKEGYAWLDGKRRFQ
ncbi:hypothetical protein PLICRDRAFT_169248 [Plicaturopsis crispa FD-325 SS-3]|nr:hypothetical protein PLICRDRAFT_169248 [Plicaturopsis crispa FD-325 SS-3]